MDLILLLALLTPPLSAGLLALVLRRHPLRVAWFNVCTLPVSFAAAAAIAVRLAAGGAPVVVGQAWRLDSLSALFAVLVSGVAMVGVAWSSASRAGLAFNMPLDWYAMVAIFFVMLAVFLHVRLPLFARVGRAMAAETWPAAGAALNAIRWEVAINLVLGIFVVALVRLGAAA